MGELSEQNRALIESALDAFARAMWDANKHVSTSGLNRLLDAARTEGRGAGEPVASDKALFDALWELVAAMANEGIPQTPRTKAAFKVAHQAALDRLRKDWSSPIREPEISRTELIKLLADHFGFRPYEQMAEDKSDLRGKIRDGYDVNEPTKSDLAEVADAILNLAPVAKGAGAEPGAGWVYNSPDTGMEYSTEHPLESGEIPDATDVRRSTFFEDWMFGEIGRLDAKVRELVVNLAPAGGRSQAMADVAAERQRQVEVEGWTPEHDDGHGGDLLTAAVCYAQRRMDEDRFGVFANYAPAAWPWGASWWKPKDRRRDLIRAAALLVAEIERIDRVPPPPQEQGGMK